MRDASARALGFIFTKFYFPPTSFTDSAPIKPYRYIYIQRSSKREREEFEGATACIIGERVREREPLLMRERGRIELAPSFVYIFI